MPKFILSPQHPVGFHRFSDCFFIFRLSGRIQSPYLFRLNVRDLLQLRRIRFRAVLCFSRAALLICSESDTSLNNYNIKLHKRKRKGKRYSCNCISLFIPFSALSCTDLAAVHRNEKKFSQNQKINERMHNTNSLKESKMYKINKQK